MISHRGASVLVIPPCGGVIIEGFDIPSPLFFA
jgi:hypothetical protein